ncbi:hypothetical protein [Yoonia sp.]|uniref:hypothetical protein n=1 Tax=Yoonia sp. TaxID=2212373 RepID=UPI00239D802B|nr:hypothetical protein [Yoonia sp.]MDE0851749.1 hypothetical protein [Yoonia sp.]
MGKSQAYRDDNERAKAHAYANNGALPNPYETGTRPHRLWGKWRTFYLQMKSQFDELAQAYGEFRPTEPQ